MLVVDEQEESREDLVQQLQAWRATCDGAASAASGYERLLSAARAGRPYDAAVLDMELTHTSGLALAASIKADAGARAQTAHTASRLFLRSQSKKAL